MIRDSSLATVLQNVGKLKLLRLDDEFVFRLYSKIQKVYSNLRIIKNVTIISIVASKTCV